MPDSTPSPTARAGLPGELRLVGRILTPWEQIGRGLLVASGGRIQRVEHWHGPPPPGGEEVAGWIMPGLIDLQVNGFGGQDFASPSADLSRASLAMAAHGVTAFLPTLISAPLHVYLDRMPALAASVPGATSLGVHLEGPYLSPARRGAHPASVLRPPEQREVELLLAGGPVRMMTLAPEGEGGLDTVLLLRERGVVVSLGHSDATYAQAAAALEMGATAATHLFNAMRPFGHREPGLVGAVLADARATVGLIADGVHLHPAAVRLALLAKTTRRIALVTDAIAAAGVPPGSYQLAQLEVHARDGEARLADGTLAGSVLTMERAVTNFHTQSGCSLPQAVEAATATPAEVLRLPHKGRLVADADADIVVLSPDLQISRTYVGGRLVYSSAWAEHSAPSATVPER